MSFWAKTTLRIPSPKITTDNVFELSTWAKPNI